MTRKTETIAHLDASIARWKTRLKRSVTMIDKLEKKRKRMLKVHQPSVADRLVEEIAAPVAVKVTSHPVANPNNVKLTFEPLGPTGLSGPQCHGAVGVPDPDANLDIPEFLRRGQAAQKAVDAVIADQIRKEQATTKVAKARGRIATMKAKKAGETRKMPVSGKAALDLIRNG
jgi:hypothetical protein